MKRILSVIIPVFIFLFVLVGCSDSSDSSPNMTKAKNTDVEEEIEEPEEVVLFENAEVKIVTRELVYDSIFGPELKIYIENNSNKNLIIQCGDEVDVNGYTISVLMSTDVNAGKKAVGEVTFLDLEDCGIEEIEEVEINFSIINADTWDSLYTTPTTTLYFG